MIVFDLSTLERERATSRELKCGCGIGNVWLSSG